MNLMYKNCLIQKDFKIVKQIIYNFLPSVDVLFIIFVCYMWNFYMLRIILYKIIYFLFFGYFLSSKLILWENVNNID
jgi:hypothetical protein